MAESGRRSERNSEFHSERLRAIRLVLKWAINLGSRKEKHLGSRSDLKSDRQSGIRSDGRSVLDSVCTSLQVQEARSSDPKLVRLVKHSELPKVYYSEKRLDSDLDLQRVHQSGSPLAESERRSERNSDFHSERSKALHLERQWVIDLDLKSDHR